MSVGVALGIMAVMASASAVAALSGFGFALISVPPLAMLLGPKEAVVLSALVGWMSPLLLAFRLRGHIRWKHTAPLAGSALVGMPIGLLILDAMSPRALRVGIAAVVVTAATALWRGVRIERPTRLVEAAGGLMSGLLNTSVGTPGPPVVLVLQARALDPLAFRATVSVQFLILNAVSMVLFAVTGRVTGELLAGAVVAIPALAVGFPIGYAVSRRVTVAQFRRIVLVLLMATATTSAIAALM